MNRKSFLLILVLSVFTFLLSTGMTVISKDDGSILPTEQTGDTMIIPDGNITTALNLLVFSFEERVDGIMAALRVLANTQEVLSGDWSKMKPLLRVFNESYEGLAMYIEANGDYYTVQRDWTGLNLSDRGYFPILQNGNEVLGYQVMSRSTGKRSVVFGVPVIENGVATSFVGLSAFFDNLNLELISRFQPSPGLQFYAFDGQNTLALSDNTALLLGSLATPVPGISKGLEILEEDSNAFLVRSECALEIAYYRRSQKNGWTFVLTKELESYGENPAPDQLLRDVQTTIQEHFNRLDAALSMGAQEMRETLNDQEGIRELLKRLYERNPEVVDVSFIDSEGILRFIYPEEYAYVEGEWIGDQKQILKLKETGKPVLSESFMAVEGFQAVDLEWPVFKTDSALAGSLSFLIRPESFLAPIIIPNNLEPYEFWIMQPDGTIFYDEDKIEIGRNLFSDPFYEPFGTLIDIGREISERESGEGHYTFYSKGMDRVVKKAVKWSSVGLHGTLWRLVLTESLE